MSANDTIVFLVDDDPGVQLAHERLLRDAGLRSRSFASAHELLAAIETTRPGCIVLDVRLPGMSGLEVQRRLAERRMRAPIVMLTAFADVPTAVRALKAGAFDFLEKPCTSQRLLEAIERALAHDAHERARTEHHAGTIAAIASLSRREREVMELVLEGLPSRTIAQRLAIREGTVENHRTSIMRKLGVTCVAALVRRVLEAGPLPAPDPR
jgi:FixJ family two-component response regulator